MKIPTMKIPPIKVPNSLIPHIRYFADGLMIMAAAGGFIGFMVVAAYFAPYVLLAMFFGGLAWAIGWFHSQRNIPWNE